MRVLFALPGLHRIDRGAEVAFISLLTSLSVPEVTSPLLGPASPDKAPDTVFCTPAVFGVKRLPSFPRCPFLRLIARMRS